MSMFCAPSIPTSWTRKCYQNIRSKIPKWKCAAFFVNLSSSLLLAINVRSSMNCEWSPTHRDNHSQHTLLPCWNLHWKSLIWSYKWRQLCTNSFPLADKKCSCVPNSLCFQRYNWPPTGTHWATVQWKRYNIEHALWLDILRPSSTKVNRRMMFCQR